MKNVMVPKSEGQGELPPKLLKEFFPELAAPVTAIFQNILETGIWPKQWKIETGIPLKKTENPQNEDQIRVISLTPFFSKVLEKIVIQWLMDHIGEKIDQKQFGGKKGTATTHYLIELITFILYNQDIKQNQTHAVITAMVDFSKAFNRIDHNLIISQLAEMGVPGWLLRIVISFLTGRKLQVKYRGAVSELLELPGGGPQGTILGMFFFIVLINPVRFSKAISNIGEMITAPLEKRMPMEELHLKFIDDLTLAEAVNLRENLKLESNPTRPVTYHERTGHVLSKESSKIQRKLNEIIQYTNEKGMIINESKTKAMIFNTSQKYDFLPKLSLNKSGNVEVVDEIKLLGVKITSDLKWHAHTTYITKKGNKRLWMLRRLKPMGAPKSTLIDLFNKQIRSVLEYALPAWGPGLTSEDQADIERVQKSAIAIIFGNADSYNNLLKKNKIDTLAHRRNDLIKRFAKKSSKHNTFNSWFKEHPHNVKTRNLDKFLAVPTRHKRFQDSPIPTMTKMLNS